MDRLVPFPWATLKTSRRMPTPFPPETPESAVREVSSVAQRLRTQKYTERDPLSHFPSVIWTETDEPPGWHASCNLNRQVSGMKTKGIWIETVALGTALACALALLIAILAAGTEAVTGREGSGQVTESDSARQSTFDGMVTCTRCGAKHSAALGQTASDCTRQCVHGGAAFALVDGDRSYALEGDLSALKRVAGERARVVGAVRGNTIQVQSITAAN